MSDNPIDVSVVVCTYNRAAFLRDALASLKALVVEESLRHEIVVIDNASTDETSQVIAEAALDSPCPLRGGYEAKPGVAAARNCGIRESRGQWIAFFDDDQIADSQWLAELLAMARAKSIRCVGGSNRLRLPPGTPAQLGPEICGQLGASGGGDSPRPYDMKLAFATNNLLIHRTVFAEVGVFDETAVDGGEDSDLFRRVYAAGIQSWYTPRAFSFHVVPPHRLTAPYLRWKALRGGGHIARRNWRNKKRIPFLLDLFARVGQALLVYLPKFLASRVLGTCEQALDARCFLWRAEGYIRYSLSYLFPKLCAQRAFFAGLDFRSERELFGESTPLNGSRKPEAQVREALAACIDRKPEVQAREQVAEF
jgi:succinoglycan biosynthesis protein ExoM